LRKKDPSVIEDRIADHILAVDELPTLGLARIYRNTVWRAWLSAMAHQFPSTLEAIGQPRAEAVVRLFLQRNPPSSAVLIDIGEAFPHFLKQDCRAEPTLIALAEADWLWHVAHVAPDAPCLGADEWARLTENPEDPIDLHPACQWVSPTAETTELAKNWAAGRPGHAPLVGAGLLFGRPYGAVVAVGINAAESAFLNTLKTTHRLLIALEAALAVPVPLDITSFGQTLMNVGALTPNKLNP
jgi:hypothetical protein